MYLQNCYAGFRYDFNLKAMPDKAPLRLTADQSYRLYVNGRYVCRGPVRGQQKNWQVDCVDIGAFLKPGRNFIAVEAYNPGISTFSYTHRDCAGFLCAAKWEDGTEFYSNANDWNMVRLSEYAPNTARLSVQMNFQEELDLRRNDRSMLFAEERFFLPPQEKWTVRGTERAFGSLPWTGVRMRTLPMLDEHLSAPERAVMGGFGTAVPIPHNNISWHFAEQELHLIQWEPPPEFCREGEFLSGELPPCGPGKLYAVTFDLGSAWLPGTPVLEVENGSSGDIAELHYFHYLPDGKAELLPAPGAGSLLALASRLYLNGPHCRHEFYQIMGVRHVTLVIRETSSPLKIRLSWRCAVYPLNLAGNFRSSETEWNEIYRICRHTQQVCSMDAFVDTPWREQSQWWGDARVQAKNTHWLSGDERLLEQGLFSIAEQPDAPEGLIFANAPTTQSGNILPDFCLTWIATLYDLYFQTGRTDFLSALHPRMKRIFDYFERQRNETGVIAYDSRFWLFEDWSDLPKKPYPCFLNLWHLLVLEMYCRLLRGAGLDTNAVSAKIEWERDVLAEAFFNPERQLFMPVLNEQGKQAGTPSVHDQILAVLLNLKPKAHAVMVEQRIRPCLLGTLADGAQPNAFWSTSLLDAAQRLNLYSEALAYIRRKWTGMIPSGTTWEVFERGGYTGWSYSHAWSAHPATHLPEILCGVVQLEPAWKKIRFKPFFPEKEKSASAAIPTPNGLIEAEWKREGSAIRCSLNLPPGTAAEIELPGILETVSSPWSKTISI